MTIPIDAVPPISQARRESRWKTFQAVTCLWAVAILIACWTPPKQLPVSESNSTFPNLDKLVHGGIFAVFGFLAMVGQFSWRRTTAVAVVGVALAAISELGQALPIVGRDADLGDGMADSMGLLLGMATCAALAACLRQVWPERGNA